MCKSNEAALDGRLFEFIHTNKSGVFDHRDHLFGKTAGYQNISSWFGPRHNFLITAGNTDPVKRSDSILYILFRYMYRCAFVLCLLVSLQYQVHISSGHQTLCWDTQLLHQVCGHLNNTTQYFLIFLLTKSRFKSETLCKTWSFPGVEMR